ncbi:MAG: class II fructose-bisphosphate aldolase [Alkalibacterium sp.]|nr:class II fructose-bisphosphate aldolase [Alkalibacterium sp.]
MNYVNGNVMLKHAYENKYAIGAFSAHNVETLLAILEASKKEQAPVMIMIGQKVINTLGLKQMKLMIDAFIEEYKIPVAIHLDHSRNFQQVLEAIQLGFQSVMFDGSSLPFEENAAITKKVVEVARALNIGSEGEIGKIGGTEDDITVDEDEALITTVEEAIEFVNATDVDYLALSIGTAHGIYKKEPKLRFDRLEDISKSIKRPIVLHGGSGVPDDQVKKAINLGVAKVNVDTELREAFTKGIQSIYENNPDEYVLADSLGSGRRAMQAVVEDKIRIFGSSGKSKELMSSLN